MAFNNNQGNDYCGANKIQLSAEGLSTLVFLLNHLVVQFLGAVASV
jgi:hypothetical protein